MKKCIFTVILSLATVFCGAGQQEPFKFIYDPFADEGVVLPEQMPVFGDEGDYNAFRIWVMNQVRYPQVAAENGIQGRVMLSFLINEEGRLTDIEITQSPDTSMTQEVLRILESCPPWTPGMHKGVPIVVQYSFMVDFRLH